MSSRLPLFIDKAIQQALIDSAYKNRISTLYAAQLHLIKSLHTEDFLKDGDYQRLLQQFSQPLTKEETPKPQTPEEMKQQQTIDEKNRLFKSISQQWHIDHKPQVKDGKKVTWKEYWLMEAEKWQSQCEEAKKLIDAYAGRVFVK